MKSINPLKNMTSTFNFFREKGMLLVYFAAVPKRYTSLFLQVLSVFMIFFGGEGGVSYFFFSFFCHSLFSFSLFVVEQHLRLDEHVAWKKIQGELPRRLYFTSFSDDGKI